MTPGVAHTIEIGGFKLVTSAEEPNAGQEVALGAMIFGGDWGWGSFEEARAIYGTYRAVGRDFIDIANVYTNGTSESSLANNKCFLRYVEFYL